MMAAIIFFQQTSTCIFNAAYCVVEYRINLNFAEEWPERAGINTYGW
jgi:hypothetical protein